MKVVFISQLPFSLAFGGLEIQVLETAKALQKLGVEVELLNPWKQEFDAELLHCFSSEYQLWEVVKRAKGKGIPVVVSGIFAPKAESSLYRLWRIIDPMIPVQTSFRMRKNILKAADAIITHSKREAYDLASFFGIPINRFNVIPNGVRDFQQVDPKNFGKKYGLEKFALCVASIEKRKNQLRLIKALEKTEIPLVLIGPARPDESSYVEAVREQIRRAGNVMWIGRLAPDSTELAEAYAGAHVHVLPSLSEGQGLASLEAANAGANIVMSGLPYLKELFGEYAWYCNPQSERSIRRAVLEAWSVPRGIRYKTRPPWLLTWEEVARRLIGVYEKVLSLRRKT